MYSTLIKIFNINSLNDKIGIHEYRIQDTHLDKTPCILTILSFKR